jgi:hypothetical protein
VSLKPPTNKKQGFQKPKQYPLPFKGKLSRLLEEDGHRPLREEIINFLGEEESQRIVRPPGRQIVLPTDKEVRALERPEYSRYKEIFPSSFERHTKKWAKGTWYTVSGPPPKHLMASFLETGDPAIGVLGQWYPKYMIVDIDESSPERVEEIRAKAGFDETNSFLCSSESENSYHLILLIKYRGKPPTLQLLTDITQRFAVFYGVEVYPQKERTIRLPFGPGQGILDPEYEALTEWYEKFDQFMKTHPYDLSRIPRHQIPMDLIIPGGMVELGDPQTAIDLIEHGLQSPSSRHEAQYKILNYYWRRNEDPSIAVKKVKRWIRSKHNEFSKEVNRGAWREIDQEIERQASWVYARRDQMALYPDSTHNDLCGFLAKQDLVEIVRIAQGNLPKMRFDFNLIKYVYPRKHLSFINIHRDKLVTWSNERTYLRYLNELVEKRIVERTRSYLVGQFAKSIKLSGWRFQSKEKAVLYSGRSIDRFEDAVRLTFEPWEFRGLLRSVGVERTTALKMVNNIFMEGVTPASGILDVGDVQVRMTK